MDIDSKEIDSSEDEKSSAPLHSIDFCISMIKAIISQRGENYFSKKEASLLLGKSESNLSTKLGASGQYGLLLNDRGRGYKPSALYQKIEFPTSVEQRTIALLQVMNSPNVYNKIIEDYNGKVLPSTDQMFSNLLVTEYGMIKTSADKASKIFFENAKSLGIIDTNNRLRYLVPIAGAENISSDSNINSNLDKNVSNSNSNNSNLNNNFADGMIEILIPLKGLGRKALLQIPEEYKAEDLTRISKFVAALKDEE